MLEVNQLQLDQIQAMVIQENYMVGPNQVLIPEDLIVPARTIILRYMFYSFSGPCLLLVMVIDFLY